VTTLSGAYLGLVLPLSLKNIPFVHLSAPGSDRQRKLASLLQSYALLWALLAASTVLSSRLGMGGTYFITAWNICLLIGTLLALGEAWLRAGPRHQGRSDLGEVEHRESNGADGNDEQRYLVRGVRYEVGGTDTGARDGETGEDLRVAGVVETEPTEITPLIAQQRREVHDYYHGDEVDASEEKAELAWWILQMGVVVPVPLVLIAQIGLLLMNASAQTLVDGNSPISGEYLILDYRKHIEANIVTQSMHLLQRSRCLPCCHLRHLHTSCTEDSQPLSLSSSCSVQDTRSRPSHSPSPHP
jgi:hypothetical protein